MSHPAALRDFRNTRQWPPAGFSLDADIVHEDAEDIICAGASTFKGFREKIPNATGAQCYCHAVMESEHARRRDRAFTQHDAFDLASLSLAEHDATDFVWETLEQPSMAYSSGKIAGTCTLEYYVSRAGETRPTIRYPSNAEPKKVTMLTVLERLKQLDIGLDAEVSIRIQVVRPPTHFLY